MNITTENTTGIIKKEFESQKDLILKRDPFLNLYIPEYIDKNFNYLITIDTANFNNMNISPESVYNNFNDIQEIHKDYGKSIIDLYKEKIKEIYNVPPKVKFNINEDESIETADNITVEDNDRDTTNLENYINHYNIKNALVTGATMYNWQKIFALIKDDLNILHDNLYGMINTYICNALIAPYLRIPKKQSILPIAGKEQLNIQENKIDINVSGVDFIVQSHELLKGIYDIYNEHSFPRDIDICDQLYLRKVCGSFYLEHWHWLYSTKFWIDFVENKYKTPAPYYLFVFDVFKKNYEQLLNFLSCQ